MKKNLVAPPVKDESFARVLKAVYKELNDLWERMPEAQSAPVRESEGMSGDVRIVNRDGKTFIHVRSKNGWSEVEATPISR